jgi:3-isopropylmalate/(R)-2-methylmalate dehydratase small subunit
MSGHAFTFGDNITTDALAPGSYMKGSIAELAVHCLESVDVSFASQVRPGDIVVGLENFGMGSSREQAVLALKELGVATVIARSFAGLFFRNCVNLGVTPLTCADADRIIAGDELACDAVAGIIHNVSRGESYACAPVPPPLQAMLDAGGLLPFLKLRLAARNAPTP